MAEFFVCSRCSTVDLVDIVYEDGLPPQQEDQLCHECKYGTWHFLFEKSTYRPEYDYVVNRPNQLGL